MAVPYSDAEGEILNGHLRVRHSGSWRTIDDVHVKDGGQWRRAREVYIKHSGSWRSVHEGDHFLFKTTRSSNNQDEFNLNNWLSGQGWNGSDPVKGVLIINNQQQRVRINSLPSDSRVYLRVNNNKRIQGKGGNGGNRGGQQGQAGQRALYTRATTILNNKGIIAGGGGGGKGGNNAQCTYQNFGQYGCMKGSQCPITYQNFSQALGGGGGGGAGYPGGQGKHGGQNGTQNSGGNGGGNGGCGSNSGGGGGNMGQQGGNNGGSNGAGINGASYITQYDSGNGDVRGGQNN